MQKTKPSMSINPNLSRAHQGALLLLRAFSLPPGKGNQVRALPHPSYSCRPLQPCNLTASQYFLAVVPAPASSASLALALVGLKELTSITVPTEGTETWMFTRMTLHRPSLLPRYSLLREV